MMQPITPVAAATVVLARASEPTGMPWQVFMVRRHVRSDFAADVFVFPGGKVEAQDYDSRLEHWTTAHPGPGVVGGESFESWRAMRVAAVRELFEEAGVLLARRDGESVRLVGEEAIRFTAYRRRLHAGELTLVDLAEVEKLEYPLDRLHAISRWITPQPLPRRFDTHFFLAHMPEDQEPIHDQWETTDSIWISPGDALRRHAEGEFPLVFATQKHLERLAQQRSIDAVISSVTPADLAPVTPKMIDIAGETKFLIPGDEGYE